MNFTIFLSTTFLVVLGAMFLGSKEKEHHSTKTIYEFRAKTIDGEEKSLADYKGKVLLIVNVASKGGFTPQYEGLEALYRQYKDRGFEILGFPANNFLNQEPGTDNVTFDMFSKISVKGNDIHPLYRFLTEESNFPGSVKWNFQKYLISRDGFVVAKFSPSTSPSSKELTDAIEAQLAR